MAQKQRRSMMTADQKKEVDRRLLEYEQGIGQTFTWAETEAMIAQALADVKKKKSLK